jgi:hypothetical protein
LAAVINLLDNREIDGGFHCAPGFPSVFDDWRAEHKWQNAKEVGSYNFNINDKNDMKYLGKFPSTRISAAAGTLIIWNQKMPHGSRPNESDRPRCAQFVKVFPRLLFTKSRLECRRKVLTRLFKEAKFRPSPIGRIVFGLD